MTMNRSKLKTNRHRATSGQEWGWVEAPDGSHVLFWEGPREKQAARLRAAELDSIGWEHLTAEERRGVKAAAPAPEER